MAFNSKKEITVPPTTPEPAVERTVASVSSVPEENLPKLVMCFDISTLSLQNLKTIAEDLKVPGYSNMTKEQLCETLLAL